MAKLVITRTDEYAVACLLWSVAFVTLQWHCSDALSNLTVENVTRVLFRTGDQKTDGAKALHTLTGLRGSALDLLPVFENFKKPLNKNGRRHLIYSASHQVHTLRPAVQGIRVSLWLYL